MLALDPSLITQDDEQGHMLQTILGKKLYMTSRFDSNGTRVPVTVIAAEPNTILAVRTQEKDGYSSAQIGTGQSKHTNKPMLGHIKKANLEKAPRFIKETRVTEELLTDVQAGQSIAIADVVKSGDLVDIQGVSKGKGFQGGIKRWGFHGGPASHGQSDRHRAPGSIGSGTTPGRVYKGKKMAGQMGAAQVTVKKLTVFDIDDKEGKLEVMGSVPGPNNGFLVITVVGENKKYVGPVREEVEEPVVEEKLKANVEAGAKEVLEAETAEEAESENRKAESEVAEVKEEPEETTKDQKDNKDETKEEEKENA